MRIRTLLTAVALAGGLFAVSATPAAAAAPSSDRHLYPNYSHSSDRHLYPNYSDPSSDRHLYPNY